MNYTNVDDHNLDKMADMVILNCKHDFSPTELKQEADMLAQCVSDKATEEANKKVAMSVFKNKIDTLQGQINSHASNINHGFTYIDKAATMYRDYENKRRVYFDKQTGDYLKDEGFHPSDFQHKLKLDEEEDARQSQIEENNAVGEAANESVFTNWSGEFPSPYSGPDENGFYTDSNGNKTDIKPVEQRSPDIVDQLIAKKKSAGKSKEKPVPKDNLGPHYNKSAEFEEESGEQTIEP